MIGFDKPEAEKLGSEGRYEARLQRFKNKGCRLPRLTHYWWWFIHNAVAHLFLALFPYSVAFRFHDWTSTKLNSLD